MNQGIAYIDGKTCDLSEAFVPLMDRGYLLGDGVFETMRASNGRVYRLDDHAARIVKGLTAINLDVALESEFRDAVTQLVAQGTKTLGSDLYIRVMVTTGPMEDLLETGRGVTVTGLVKKFKPYPMLYYAQGIHLITSQQTKQAGNPLSGIKTLSFLPYVTARREALAATVHDALLLNQHGRVAEASTSNVFAFAEGAVYAPGESEGAIPGVTRKAVLDLLQETGIVVHERLELATLEAAEEVWLTNTTGGIVPVTKFNGKPIGDGHKGDLTTRLLHALELEVRGQILA